MLVSERLARVVEIIHSNLCRVQREVRNLLKLRAALAHFFDRIPFDEVAANVLLTAVEVAPERIGFSRPALVYENYVALAALFDEIISARPPQDDGPLAPPPTHSTTQ